MVPNYQLHKIYEIHKKIYMDLLKFRSGKKKLGNVKQ